MYRHNAKRSGEIFEFLVDDEDAGLVDHKKWELTPNGYVRRTISGNVKIYLHRLITEARPGFDVDHINGDKLDNRRCNLRVCSRSENNYNRKKSKANTSGFKGVSKTDGGRWNARISMPGGFYKHLGNFETPEAAHLAYVVAAKQAHGDFANV